MSVLRMAGAFAGCAVVLAGCGHFGLGQKVDPNPFHEQRGAAQASLGVNAFLWRASLDTLAFMPLSSADPYGVVIITDWYVNPEKPDERFKTTVYILDTRLRADGLSVTVNKQVKDGAGSWVNAPVNTQTDVDMENAILTRARQLRLSTIDQKG